LLEDQRKLLSEMEICRDRLQKAESALAAQSAESVVESASGRTTGMQRQKKQSRSIGFDVCRRCDVKGHWARECPMTSVTSNQAVGGGNDPAHRIGANALTASSRPQVKVNVQIVCQGQFYRVLLDTGCDVSVMKAHVLLGLSYQNCTQKLYAANSSAVPISGSTELQYRLGGVEMNYQVLVSEAIEDRIFGADWLNDHRCIWDFTRGTLYTQDGERPRPVTMWTSNRRPCVRRLYAKETVEIPSHAQIDIPVKSV
jgi:predicted aspartyl protease